MELCERNNTHKEAVQKEQDQVKELLRRGTVRHYFTGPESIWTKEGFGIVVGGLLTTGFGLFIFPSIIQYLGTSQKLEILCMLLVITGTMFCIKGVYQMIQDGKMRREPVSDEVFDQILAHDLEELKKISQKSIEESCQEYRDEIKNIDEFVLVKGPRDYVYNVNLPLLMKVGEDNKVRYSNFSLMALFLGKERAFLFTSIYNMRDGKSKFHHVYECPYGEMRFVGFRDQKTETINQKGKSLSQNLKVMVIDAGEGEHDTLSIPVADYDFIQKNGGFFDMGDAQKAVEILSEKMSKGNDSIIK